MIRRPFAVVFVGCVLINISLMVVDVAYGWPWRLVLDSLLLGINSLCLKRELILLRAAEDTEFNFGEDSPW